MFVSVLPAGARSGIPFDAKVAIAKHDDLHRGRINDRDGDGGGMDAALAFSWRDPLNTMPACFLVQL